MCERVCWLRRFFFFFQAEDGIRDLVRSRGLGDVYKRQAHHQVLSTAARDDTAGSAISPIRPAPRRSRRDRLT